MSNENKTEIINKVEAEQKKADQNSVEQLAKKQKPKKSLKKRLIAWVLGLGIAAGAVAGGTYIYKDQTKGDGAYNREAKHKYEQLDESLSVKLEECCEFIPEVDKVTHIEFMEPEEESVDLKVFYEEKETEDVRGGYAIFDVMIEYYNALVEAEESGNVLYYLDAMQKIVDNMIVFESSVRKGKIDLKLPANTAENLAVFNDVFNVSDVNDPNIIRQVGFLPYHVECVEHHKEYVEGKKRYVYTYKISGISYCETKEESTAEVEKSSKLLMEANYDKTHLKAYNREMTFSTYDEIGQTFNLSGRLSGDMYLITVGENNPYTVKTTYFEEMDLMKMFYEMKDGNFKFEKPEDFNVKEYVKAYEKAQQKNNQ